MRVLVFITILTLSFTLYAKTEATVGLEGFTSKQARIIANTTDGLNALSQIGNLNKPKPSPQILGSFFGDNSGALTKKRTPATKSSKKRVR